LTFIYGKFHHFATDASTLKFCFYGSDARFRLGEPTDYHAAVQAKRASHPIYLASNLRCLVWSLAARSHRVVRRSHHVIDLGAVMPRDIGRRVDVDLHSKAFVCQQWSGFARTPPV
jgi:hypothetical protein